MTRKYSLKSLNNNTSKSPINYKGLSSKSPMRLDFNRTPINYKKVAVEKPKVALK